MINPAPAYQVKLPDFEGPLDLLLYLIEREEMDITSVSLAAVTSQYLEYIGILEQVVPDSLADFLVIAAKLILIKSQALLPRPPEAAAEGEGDTGDDLVRQLIAYKQFKEVARGLGELETANRQTFIRVAPPPKIETKVDLSDVGIQDLARLLRAALAIDRPAVPIDAVVRPFTLTIRDQIALIQHRLRQQPEISFSRLLSQARSRVEIIVTFLAVLELLKRHAVRVTQAAMFGDIVILPSDERLTNASAPDDVAEPLMDEEDEG